jgi:hypothetical protein
MGRAPHEIINARRAGDIEYDAWRASLEAKYGVPYDKLPEALRSAAPEHPQRANARRYDYRSVTGWRWNYQSRATRHTFLAPIDRLGWRTRRRQYLRQLEERRQAEIVVRQMRAKRTGRGKLLDRKAHVHARERIEAREWRDEL